MPWFYLTPACSEDLAVTPQIISLQDRVKKLSKETGRDAPEIYREIAFDRFLARLDFDKWTLKGGYSLERRLTDTRFTKDIDLITTLEQAHETVSRYYNLLGIQPGSNSDHFR